MSGYPRQQSHISIVAVFCNIWHFVLFGVVATVTSGRNVSS